MKFQLDGLDVYWPYEAVYPEQYDYMLELKRALDAKGGCLLESPTGTGKSCSLLSLITSYQFAHPECGKLIYCTRTVPEMTKAIEELKRVISHRTELLGGENAAPPFLGVCLSSRRNMCVHPTVQEESIREQVDSLCRKKIAPWVRQRQNRPSAPTQRGGAPNDANPATGSETASAPRESITLQDMEDFEAAGLCSYYENYVGTSSDVPMSNGIYTIDDMQTLGREKRWCPYFVTRHVLSFANVVIYNYQYMLDPKVSQMVSKEISRDSIVVFDEAHNIDNVCIEALSVNFNRRALDNAASNVTRLTSMIAKLKETDAERLRQEYERLVQGLSSSGVLGEAAGEEQDVLSNPIHLPDEILNEAIPGNIRKADHFIQLLDLVVKHLKQRMRVDKVIKETPLAFLHEVQNKLQVDGKTLQFSYTRLSSLMRTLKVIDLEEFVPISAVADFLTLVSTPAYKDGFMLIIEPFDTRTPEYKDPVLQLACLDSSLAIKPVLERFATVVITSGTLSPIDLYPKLLGFKPVCSKQLSMSIIRSCICPMVVTRGADQTPITSAFSARGDKSVVINYGGLLIDLAKTVPDGIVCFFTSYEYMENVIAEWYKLRIIDRILDHKLLFIETKDIVETTLALDNFRRACDCGRGAVFLSVARGKVSEGIDFDRHYGRAVVLFGIPFQYTKSHILLARLEYLRSRFQIREEEFLTFDALRQASQCVGRVIRSKTDYGIMVFADKRYNKESKRSKLPPWITQFLAPSNLNLSTEEAVTVCREFLRELAQPLEKDAGVSTMLRKDDLARLAGRDGNGTKMELG